MPQIRPFRALRYDFSRFDADLSAVVAPPYDVLDAGDKASLLGRHERNIVAIDLPHIPPKAEGPPEAYAAARLRLEEWLADGTLVREPQPALYLYHQTFEYERKRYTRRQFVAALRLHEFSEQKVLPHERTFGGPRADRLALTRETQCNLSPVFGLYTDPEDRVGEAFAATAGRSPDAVATLDDVQNEIWCVTDGDVIDRVCGELADKRVYIADGHHRYTTALTYREEVTHQAGGSLPETHPANFVLVVLASMDDPGCVIQGYCRVLRGSGVTAAALVDAWQAGAASAPEDQADLVLYDGTTRQRTGLKFTNRAALDTRAADRHPSWRKLDIAYLHTYLIDDLAVGAGLSPEIGYMKSVQEACALAESESSVAVMPRPTPMSELREVSEAGELMPQKSTFFYPKLATGLAIHPLV